MLSLRAPRARVSTATRRRAPMLALVIALVIAVALGGCSSSSAGAERPTTKANLEIVSPAPNAHSGPDVDLRIELTKASVAPSTQVGGRLRPDRGHIHVSVDGQLVAMPYTLDQVIPGLTPGTHTIQAEFVATDHLAFANRVLTAVTFTVQ